MIADRERERGGERERQGLAVMHTVIDGYLPIHMAHRQEMGAFLFDYIGTEEA